MNTWDRKREGEREREREDRYSIGSMVLATTRLCHFHQFLSAGEREREWEWKLAPVIGWGKKTINGSLHAFAFNSIKDDALESSFLFI